MRTMRLLDRIDLGRKNAASRASNDATGYRPAMGVSLSGFLFWIAVALAVILVPMFLAPPIGWAILTLVMSVVIVAFCVRDILHPLRDRETTTATERRNARLGSIALLILFTAIATNAVKELLGSGDGVMIDWNSPWFGILGSAFLLAIGGRWAFQPDRVIANSKTLFGDQGSIRRAGYLMIAVAAAVLFFSLYDLMSE